MNNRKDLLVRNLEVSHLIHRHSSIDFFLKKIGTNKIVVNKIAKYPLYHHLLIYTSDRHYARFMTLFANLHWKLEKTCKMI